MRTDVLVIGGGSAGLAAAVNAGRTGAKTLLVERHGALGGMATASLVHSICGLYLIRDKPGAEPANAGFPTEFASRLIAAGGAWGPRRMGRVDVLMHSPPAFARLCDQLIHQTPTIYPRLHTELIDLTTAPTPGGRRVESVEISTRGRRQTIEPGVVIDASGDAAAAAMAGASLEQTVGDRLQRPAYIFSMHGVEGSALDSSGRLRLAAKLAGAVRDNRLPNGVLGAAIRPGRPGEAFITVDLEAEEAEEKAGEVDTGQTAGNAGGYDPTDAWWLSRLEIEGRALADELSRFLRSEASGFEHSHIAALPARAGIRESRRVVGEYQLDENDILAGAEFDDAVGRATWPMEMRESANGPSFRFARENRPCEIPMRALRARGFENLLMAGRCISATHEAQASIRVIGTCLVTGEAAGKAAASQCGYRAQTKT